MRKVDEYNQHAAECRRLAKRMLLHDQRDQLLAMAETWERLARDREMMKRIEHRFTFDPARGARLYP
jgi:hypothetical protein